MPKAVIFDLDGTLWDTVAPLTLIWNQVFQKNNTGKVIVEDDLRNAMGKTLQEIIFRTLRRDLASGFAFRST